MNALSSQSRSNTSSIAPRGAASGVARSAAGRRYTIQRGDTLGELAQRFGIDVGTLARANGIANPNRIRAGATITVPSDAVRTLVVSRGDTLDAIARGAGLSVAEVLAANPQTRNPNRIYPGDRIALPAPVQERVAGPERVNTPRKPAPIERVAPVESTRLTGGALRLTETDILNIKKTLQTEWVQSAGPEQAHGIIDTILNRTASGRWGKTVADVVNAKYQFSDINGPPAWSKGRDSVEDMPRAKVSKRVDDLVDSYLAERAAGRKSSIGSHLNYANPHYSDAVNLRWINALDGPVLGRGKAIHRHGTTPELNRHRPKPFAIALPGAAQAAAKSVTPLPSGPFDGRIFAAKAGVAVWDSRVNIRSLHPAMAPVINAVAQAAKRLGLPQPMITSGNDRQHSPGSLHYRGRALDFKANNITDAQGVAFQNEVKRILGPGYDVLFEHRADFPANDHLHVEFDPN